MHYSGTGNQLWVVEDITGHKKVNNKSFYYVKWLGWSEKENTWEPKENLKLVQQMIYDFEHKQGLSTSDGEGEGTENSRRRSGSKADDSERDVEIEEIYDPRVSRNSKKIRKDTQKAPLRRSKPFIFQEDEDKENQSSNNGKIFGTFETDDAVEVLDHVIYVEEAKNATAIIEKNKTSELMFLIKWASRCDGSQAESTWYSSVDVKERCADKLVNYYEKFIRFLA